MLKLRTEEEIIASWKGDLNKPLVSVCCITYNHEQYIEDALRGFLIQETDFAFEIIVHDDASTDRTKEIILKYSRLYPKLFKIILQEKNQYSQGNHPFFEFMLPAAQGEYIALCEGDDYWCSRDKLKKQYSILSEMQLQVAFNLSAVLDNQLSELKININPATKICNKEIMHYEFSDIVDGGASLMRTGSLFLRTSYINKFPNEYKNMPALDIFIQMFCAIDGAVCINSIMTIYRTNIENSWSDKNLYYVERLKEVTQKMLEGHNLFSEYLCSHKFQKKNINNIKYRFIYQYYRMAMVKILKTSKYEQLNLSVKLIDYIRAFIWSIKHQLSRFYWRFKVKILKSPINNFLNLDKE
jgi:glycosyltransferase involved in cell wall biosynthesis